MEYMHGYDLPTSVLFGDVQYAIRSDFRPVLDIIKVIGDPHLDDVERSSLALMIFYPDVDDIPQKHLQEAVDYLLWFIGGGEEPKSGRKLKLMDWEQDFSLIVAPINRVVGYEIRSCEYLHWWSLLAAYYEIGDCLFAQVISVRKKRIAGKKLDKTDAKFYRENRALVDLKTYESDAESQLFNEWIG